MVVSVIEAEKATVNVKLSGKEATITYGDGKARFFRGLAMLVSRVKKGETEKEKEENPIFTSNGAMVDMSRNAVMNVKNIKIYFNKMALMGLNMYMFYTEDTYEIEGRPYFGYMRGPYTKAELKELDAYALELGIELIPCIQMLGHLDTHLRWDATYIYKDTNSELLIGDDETYDLGLGQYLTKNGYRERREIYFEHLARVNEMVQGYGLKPMMWSDMFFRMAATDIEEYWDYDVRVKLDENISKCVPKGVQQVFWDYYNADEDFYAINIDKHKKYLDENTMFAGGVWTWSGHTPHFSRSLRHTIPALDACRKKGLKEVLATVWGNGGEVCAMLSLAGLAWYADYDYLGHHDLESVKECLRVATGLSYDDIVKCELVEYPHGGVDGLSRCLLYNNPMVSVLDKHIEDVPMVTYYKNVTKELKNVTSNLGALKSSFDVIVALSDLLENKGDFGVRLKTAYDNGDKKTLKQMANECSITMKKVEILRDKHYAAWMEHYKPFGWEIHDIRYGGILNRFKTTKDRLLKYLSGELKNLPELEEERLRLDGVLDDSTPKIDFRMVWRHYAEVASANPISL